ncbi:hypothetical protein RM700_128 [Saccharomyces cerevisiae synthetic construct]|uniref:Uncharacterized protein YKL100W-A n=2 Tax=Saccharomyces cerevisiae TaxID=4932 RepID=YK100_YEAST|nr:RecName: Full=Uncharacterized protein YKL100W-A [Saccharomyces cerevisiae S288C]KZV09839.1 hypothetical protein WN66_03884 [Saccharomyces cerevisiae]WNV94210.1 hypothetical protein RM700_128 [Saccharomyces cerevisiae synthetic construct]CAY80991.1 EC1118_1K5_1376p [Saccharomyces cerevisiae EC1118]
MIKVPLPDVIFVAHRNKHTRQGNITQTKY